MRVHVMWGKKKIVQSHGVEYGSEASEENPSKSIGILICDFQILKILLF